MMPVGLQKGAGRLSFTMVCVPKGMHRCPRVRDNHTAASSVRSRFAVLKTYYCVIKTKLGQMSWNHIVARGRSQ